MNTLGMQGGHRVVLWLWRRETDWGERRFFGDGNEGGLGRSSGMTQHPLPHSDITGAIIGAFYDVYRGLGYGFLESLYTRALECELLDRGHRVAREVHVPVGFKGRELGRQRLDMIVNDRVVVETKATEILHPHATRQLFAYLRATNLEVGLLLHFGPQPRFHRVACLNDSRGGTGPCRSS